MRIVFPLPFRRQKTDKEPVYNGHHLFTQNNPRFAGKCLNLLVYPDDQCGEPLLL